LRDIGVVPRYVPAEKLRRLVPQPHQGIVAVISPIQYQNIEMLVPFVYEAGETPFFIIADRVTDVRNFGAIARTASCAGVHGLIIPERGSAMINSDAVKASAGALNLIPVCRSLNLKHTLQFLKDSGIKIVACTEKASKEYTETNLTVPVALLLGSEEDGISPEYLKFADDKVKIPMSGTIGSLNVSVSSAIIMYEAVRQRSIIIP